MHSSLGTLKLNDFWKGLIVAVLTAVLTVIYQSVSTGSLKLDYKTILATGATAGIAYLLKNLGTGTGGKILSNDPPTPPPTPPTK